MPLDPATVLPPARSRARLIHGVWLLLAVGPLPPAMATWPRHWWLPMALWLAGCRLGWLWAGPRWIRPTLMSTTSLPAGPLASRLADWRPQGRTLPLVRRWRTGDMTCQAVTLGIGSRQEILLTESLIENCSLDETLAVIAHELGHCRQQDSLRRWALFAVILTGVLAIAALVDTGTAWDAVILMAATAGGVLVYMAYGRQLEYLADQAACETLGDAWRYAQALRHTANLNQEALDQPRGLRALCSTHPSAARRLARLGQQD